MERVEELDLPWEFHEGDGVFTSRHLFDPKGSMLERLTRAVAMIREADRLTMEVVAEL